MVDRTSNTVFDETTDPQILTGLTNASNADTFDIPFGQPKGCICTSKSDNDAIVSATVSKNTVTIGAVDDAGANITADFNIHFVVIMENQANS